MEKRNDNWLNKAYFCDYLSKELHTMVRHYAADGSLSAEHCQRKDFSDHTLFRAEIKQDLLSENNVEVPRILTVNAIWVYASVRFGEDSLIIGPVQFDTKVDFEHDYCCELPEAFLQVLQDMVYVLPWKEYVSQILLACNILLHAPQPISEIKILQENLRSASLTEKVQKEVTNLVFHSIEHETHHNPYEQELRENASIENGDIEALRNSIEEDYIGVPGTLSKDELRNNRNLAIVVITLASRSAIRGGLSPELSFSLSDLFIQRIEELSDTASIISTLRNAEFQYARLVHDERLKHIKKSDSQSEPNPHVAKCKDYIFSHLHGRITVAEIALELHLNKDYLSDLFSRCEGISLTKYILQEKITLAKNLLTYSDYSYIEIANYLGFVSQSHLGKQFRESTGMTLREYRLKYKYNEDK